MKKKLSFDIEGMTCAVCSATCDKALKKLDGVSEVSVNLASKKAQLVYDEDIIKIDNIFKTIEDEGYNPIIKKGEKDEYRKLKQLKVMKTKLAVSLFFASIVLYIAMAPMIGLPPLIDAALYPVAFTVVQLLLTVIVMVAGYKFYTVGFRNLIRLKPNMDSLVALGTSAGFLFSLFESYKILVLADMHAVHFLFYESVAVIIALIMLGKYLEMRSVGKAGEAVKKLLDMSPKHTIIQRDGFEENIPVSEVLLGDVLIVKPGDSIAVDGEIVKGSSYIDESMLTGESLSIEKSTGSKVFAGTINKSGMLAYKAQKVGNDTILSKIIAIVEEAQGSKAPISRVADKVSAIFVPIVSIIAVLAFVLWLLVTKDFVFAVNILVSVFVIACPCALGLATPSAIITGTGKGAQLGILFKNAESLENLSKINSIIFDKTGTLTEGKPGVTDIYASEGFSLLQVLKYTASAEKGSLHPIAQAILNEAKEREITLSEVFDFKSEAGHGVQAVIEGKNIKAGNLSFFENNDEMKKQADIFFDEGKTIVAISIDDKFAGIIAVRDKLKSDTADCIKIIKNMGIKTSMLTGDNKKSAIKIANECGIDDVIAEVLPHEKADVVLKQKEKYKVAMVGDGINDAPALATADCGIAIGGGTDVAIESADIVLTGKSLKGVADALILSRKVMVNIRQNLFWAFIYNIIAIPVAAGILFPMYNILLNPMIAALAMSLSSVSVVTNALRLNLFKSRF